MRSCSGIFIALCGLLLPVRAGAQLTQIPSGTSQKLTYLSVIDGKVIAGGLFDYAGKCDSDCDSLVPLPVPGPDGYALNFYRRNLNELYCVSYTPNQLHLFKSTDNGKNWDQRLDTSASFILSRQLAFFDSFEGVISKDNTFIRTKDGGNSWTNGVSPLVWPTGITAISVWGDSSICIGADQGNFYVSKDRGHTWPYSWGLGRTIKGITYLSKDTVLVLSLNGGLSKTVNGGFNWSDSGLPMYRTYGITFKDRQEGFVVGEDISGYGMIAATKDMGLTWTTFTTQIHSTFFDIEILNDSIALIAGADGILLRWNYANAIFTNVARNYFDRTEITSFPNPVKDILHFEFNDAFLPEKLELSINNSLGQLVYSSDNFGAEQELDLSFLKAGVYYLILRQTQGSERRIFKVVKE